MPHVHPHTNGPPPHGPGGQLPPEEWEILALRRVYRNNPKMGVADVVDIARTLDPSGELADSIERDSLDLTVPMAINGASVWMSSRTFRRVQAICKAERAGPVIVLPPVPHTILRSVIDATQVTVLEAGHEVPHHLRRDRGVAILTDVVDVRDALENASAIIFDGYCSGVERILHVRRAVYGILDHRVINGSAKLYAHHRPTSVPEDIALKPEILGRVERL